MTAEGHKVIFVGAGWVTANRHIPAFKRSGRCQLLGVIDTHPERAEQVAKRHGIPHWGSDLEADWVRQATAAAIGTPPSAHRAVAVDLLERGLHVLCEKPLATTVEDGRAMVQAADRQGRILAVVHNFQFASAMVRARRLLASGRLGELTAVYAVQLSNPQRRLPSWYPELRGGLFYDEAPHLMYLLRGLLGDDLKVAQVFARRDERDQVREMAVFFDHPSIGGQLSMNFEAPLSEWQLMLVGREAMVAVDIFRDISVLVPNDRGHAARDILRTSMVAAREHFGGVARSGFGHVTGRLLYGNETVVERFLDALDSGEPPPGLSARDGLAVIESLHELLDRAGF